MAKWVLSLAFIGYAHCVAQLGSGVIQSPIDTCATMPIAIAMDPVRDMVYSSLRTWPAAIVRSFASNLSSSAQLTPLLGGVFLQYVISMAVDLLTGDLFAAGGSSDVGKISYPYFKLTAVLHLAEETNYGLTLVDSARGYVYFGGLFGIGSANTAAAPIFRAQMADLSPAGALWVPMGLIPIGNLLTGFTAGVIDSTAGFAYLGATANPALCVKIDLVSFQFVQAIPLPHSMLATSASLDTATSSIVFVLGFDTSTRFSYGQSFIVRVTTAPQLSVSYSSSALPAISGAVLEPASGDLLSAGYFSTQFMRLWAGGSQPFTEIDAALVPSPGPAIGGGVLDSARGRALFTFDTDGLHQTSLVAVSLRADAISLSVPLGAGFQPAALVVDPAGEYIYVSTTLSPQCGSNTVLQLRVADMALTAVVSMPPGLAVNGTVTGVLSSPPSGASGLTSFVLAAADTTPTLVRVSVPPVRGNGSNNGTSADFAFAGSAVVGVAAEGGLTAAAVADPASGAAGFGYFGTANGSVIAVDLARMHRLGAVRAGDTGSSVSAIALLPALPASAGAPATRALALSGGNSTAGATLALLNLTALSRSSAVKLPVIGAASCIVIDAAGDLAYVCAPVASLLLRVRLSDLAVVNSACPADPSLGTAVCSCYVAAALDSSGKFAYIVWSGWDPGVQRVRLSDFAPVGAVYGPTNSFAAAVVDPVAGAWLVASSRVMLLTVLVPSITTVIDVRVNATLSPSASLCAGLPAATAWAAGLDPVGGIESAAAAAAVASGTGAAALCTFAADPLVLTGDFFGGYGFVNDSLAVISVTVYGQSVYARSPATGAAVSGPQASASSNIVWASAVLPELSGVGMRVNCTEATFSDGYSASCNVAQQLAARVSILNGTANVAAIMGLVGATLVALPVLLTVTIEGAVPAVKPLWLIWGSPLLLSAQPAVISVVGSSLTLDAAFSEPLLPTDGVYLALAGEISSAVMCNGVTVSLDGQRLTCTVPDLQQQLLGRPLDVLLSHSFPTVASPPWMLLNSSIAYALPVFSSVTTTALAATGIPSTLSVRSLALAPPPGASAVILQAWVGMLPCMLPVLTSATDGILSCVAPLGAGANVPVTVQATNIDTGIAFNVTSAECAQGWASPYDGQLTLAPTTPIAGVRTTITFAAAAVASASPAYFAVPNLARGEADTDALTVELEFSAMVPLIALSVAVGDVPCTGLLISSGMSPTSVTATICTCNVSVAALAAAASSGTALVGQALLPITVKSQMPGWSPVTAVTTTVPTGLVVLGTPQLDLIIPSAAASAAGGSVLVLSGAALGATADDLTGVTVGGVACGGLHWLSSIQVSCVAPAFEAAEMVAAAANFNVSAGGNTIAVPVLAFTSTGGTSNALSYSYPAPTVIEWGASVAASDGVRSLNFSLAGIAPLVPALAIRVLFGLPLQCTLRMSASTSLLGSACTPLLVGATSPVLTRGTAIVTFASASLSCVESISVPLSAQLICECVDSSGNVSSTPASPPVQVAAPRLSWAVHTVDSVTNASFLPLTTSLPPIFASLMLETPVAASTGALPATVAAATSAALLTAAEHLQSCTASLSVVISGSATQKSSVTGVVHSSSTMLNDSLTAVPVSFGSLSLAGFPLGSSGFIQAQCLWGLSGSSVLLALPPLPFRVVAASMAWSTTPSALINAQSPLDPPPSVSVTVAPASMIVAVLEVLRCTMTAVPDTANDTTSIVLTDVIGPFNPATLSLSASDAAVFSFAFHTFAIAGRHGNNYTTVVTCELLDTVATAVTATATALTAASATVSLPPLTAPVQIVGCVAGTAPGGSTGWLCQTCAPGWFSDGGDQQCIGCPAGGGATCANGLLVLAPGYYLPLSQAGATFGPSTQLYPCWNAAACTLNASTRAYGCAAGYSGPLCGVCTPGYALFGVTCAACWPTSASAALAVFVLAGLTAAAAWLAVVFQPADRGPALMAFTQLTAFLQGIGAVSQVRAAGMQLVQATLGWTTALSASIVSEGPLQCLLGWSYLEALITTILLPLLLAAAAGAIAAGVSVARQRATAAVSSPKPSTQCAVGHSSPVAVVGHPGTRTTHAALRNRVTGALAMLLSLWYMPLVTASLRALNCGAPVAGVAHLESDMRVTCGSHEQVAAAAIAVCVLLLIGLGLPVALLQLIARVPRSVLLQQCASFRVNGPGVGHQKSPDSPLRHTKVDTAVGSVEVSSLAPSVPIWLKSLASGYDARRGVLWWEATVLLRKAGLVAITLLAGGTLRGLAAVLLLCIVCLVAQERVRPHIDPTFNVLETAGLAATAAVASLCLLYSDAAAPVGGASVVPISAGDAVITATCFLLVASVAAGWLTILLRIFWRSRRVSGSVRRVWIYVYYAFRGMCGSGGGSSATAFASMPRASAIPSPGPLFPDSPTPVDTDAVLFTSPLAQSRSMQPTGRSMMRLRQAERVSAHHPAEVDFSSSVAMQPPNAIAVRSSPAATPIPASAQHVDLHTAPLRVFRPSSSLRASVYARRSGTAAPCVVGSTDSSTAASSTRLRLPSLPFAAMGSVALTESTAQHGVRRQSNTRWSGGLTAPAAHSL